MDIMNIYKVSKVAEAIKDKRKGSKSPAIREKAEEANLYEKVNMIMTKGANGSPELIDEIAAILNDENKKAQKYLAAKKAEMAKLV